MRRPEDLSSRELGEELEAVIDDACPPDTHFHSNARLRAVLAELVARAEESARAEGSS